MEAGSSWNTPLIDALGPHLALISFGPAGSEEESGLTVEVTAFRGRSHSDFAKLFTTTMCLSTHDEKVRTEACWTPREVVTGIKQRPSCKKDQ